MTRAGVPRKRRRWIWWVVLAVVVVAVAALVLPRLLSSSTAETGYTTAKVERKALTSTVSGSGNLVAAGVTAVQPGITGTVEDLSVKLGDTVKAGQLLFRIVNTDLDAAVLRAEASYDQAKQQVQQAKNSLTQAQNALYNAQHPSASGPGTATPVVDAKAVTLAKQQVTAANLGITSANRNLDSASLSLSQARANADKRTVSSPVAGVVTALSAVNGQSLTGGGSSGASGSNSSATGASSAAGAAEISDLKTLRARVQVNEVDLVKVQLGQQATVQFDALPGEDVSGTVAAISPTGTNTQGVVTYDVDVVLSNIDQRLKPNMSCSVDIVIETKESALSVPTSAIRTDTSTGDKYVIVVGADGQSTRNAVVTTGIVVGTTTEVLSGVNEGDTVVASTTSSGSTSGTSGGGSGNQRGGAGGMGMFLGGGR